MEWHHVTSGIEILSYYGCASRLPNISGQLSAGIGHHKDRITGTSCINSGKTNDENYPITSKRKSPQNCKNHTYHIAYTENNSNKNTYLMRNKYRIKLSINHQRKLNRFLKILNIYPDFYSNLSKSKWKTPLTDQNTSVVIDYAFSWTTTRENLDFWDFVQRLWRQTCCDNNITVPIYLRTNTKQLQEYRNS